MDVETNEVEQPGSPLITDHGDRITEQSAPDEGVSELQRHKEARGLVEKPKDAPPEVQPEVEAKPEPKADRWSDPDTGDTYDMRHKVARRVKKLLEERGTFRGEAEKLRAEKEQLLRELAERGQVQAKPEPVATDGEPDPGDSAKYPEGQFDRAYLRDLARYEAKQVTREALTDTERRQAYAQHQRAEAETVDRWNTTLPETRKKYPDFDDVLASIPTTPENQPIVRLMLSSPVGNDVVYVMGRNEQAKEAYAMARTPEDRMRVLHHIEAQIIVANRQAAARAKGSETRAPQPTSPVHAGAGPSGPMDWSKDDPDQLSRWKSVRQSGRR
jgi:hypothetical protein